MAGAPGHEDDDLDQDDREQDQLAPPDHEQPQVADEPLFFAYDQLKKEIQNQQVKPADKDLTPVRELFPKKKAAPVEVPGIAASTQKGFNGPKWLNNFRAQLTHTVAARATVPVRISSAAPSRVPVKSTFNAAELASDSERALTKSLSPWRRPAKPWDTGASLTPVTAMNRSAPEATSPRRKIKSSRGPTRKDRPIGWNATRFTNQAAAALVGAGAYYIYKRGFGGGGGGTSQTPKFRGGSQRGAEWAIP